MWETLPADVLLRVATDPYTVGKLSCVCDSFHQVLKARSNRLSCSARRLGLRWKTNRRLFRILRHLRTSEPSAVRDSACLLRFSWGWRHESPTGPLCNLQSLVFAMMWCASTGNDGVRLAVEVFRAINDALMDTVTYRESSRRCVDAVPVAWHEGLRRELNATNLDGGRWVCWLDDCSICPVGYAAFLDEEDWTGVLGKIHSMLPDLLKVFVRHAFYPGTLMFSI